MHFFKKIKNEVSKFIAALKAIYHLLRDSEKILYRVEEIDSARRRAIIYCHGTRTILRLTIAEIIYDPEIIFNLPAVQSYKIGYYFGSIYKKGSEPFKRGKKATFLLSFKRGRFKIISQNRDGSLIYLDTKLNITRAELPINIIKNEHVISNFDPSQACYIGILTGIESNNQKRRVASSTLQNKPALIVIK